MIMLTLLNNDSAINFRKTIVLSVIDELIQYLLTMHCRLSSFLFIKEYLKSVFRTLHVNVVLFFSFRLN